MSDIPTTNPQQIDADLTAAAERQLNWPTTPADEIITISVKDGWITLKGEVGETFRKSAAESDVARLPGVKGVTNLITLKSDAAAVPLSGVEATIKASFAQSHLLNAEHIQVEICEHTVTLCGHVPNYAQLQEAGRIAWSAPGVNLVDNQLAVGW